MPLANAVIRWKDSIYRVLGFSDSTAALYEMTQPKFSIEYAPVEAIREAETLEDPYGSMRMKTPVGRSREKAQANYALIEPIVSDPQILFDEVKRNRLLRELSAGTTSQRKQLTRLLTTYWLKGQTPGALNPDYKKPTGPRVYKKKCGRKNNAGLEPPPLSDEIRKLFDAACRKYILQENGVSIKKGYTLMLQSYKAAHPDAADEALPSFNQFYYFFRNHYTPAERVSRRVNSRRYNKDRRALPGNVYDVVDGIGHTWEYDSTDADINLVSSSDRTKKIGRPRLDVVVDKYSKMIVGVKVTLQNAQYQTAADTLFIAMTDKRSFAARYGIEIEEADWPVKGKPLCILGDNGELEAGQSDVLMRGLGIKLDFSPSFRADAKGVVERLIGLVQAELDLAAGAAKPSKETLYKAGAQETRDKATVTLEEYGRCVIKAVLSLNCRRLEELPPHFPSADMMHRPIDVWRWAAANGRSRLREVNEGDETMRLAFLPHYTPTFSKRGICAEGLYYWSDDAANFGWLERGAGAERPKGMELVLNPSNVSQAWLLPDPKDPATRWPCRLHTRSAQFEGRSLFEVHSMQASICEKRQLTERAYDVLAGRTRMEILQIALDAARRTPKSSQSRRQIIAGIPAARREERIREERSERRMPEMTDNAENQATAPASDAELDDYAYPNDYIPQFQRNE